MLEKVREKYVAEIDETMQSDRRVALNLLSEDDHYHTLREIQQEMLHQQRGAYAEVQVNGRSLSSLFRTIHHHHQSQHWHQSSSNSGRGGIVSAMVADHQTYPRLMLAGLSMSSQELFSSVSMSGTGSSNADSGVVVPTRGVSTRESSSIRAISSFMPRDRLPMPIPIPLLTPDRLDAMVMNSIQRVQRRLRDFVSPLNSGASSPVFDGSDSHEEGHGEAVLESHEEDGGEQLSGRHSDSSTAPAHDPSVSSSEELTLIVYVYWRHLSPSFQTTVAPENEVVTSSSSAWNIKCLEYMLSSAGDNQYEMRDCQVRVHDVFAESFGGDCRLTWLGCPGEPPRGGHARTTG